MKKSLCIAAYLISSLSSFSVQLDYSTINYGNEDFTKYEFDGVKYYVHSKSIRKANGKTSELLNTYRFFLNKIDLITPETISKFKEAKYKIVLLEENCDGLEVIKAGQSKWDRRHDKLMEKSIVICKSVSYAEESKTDKYALFPYLVHEMMHVHHNEVLGYGFNWKLRKAFNVAKRNVNYKNDDYIFHTFSEYWAEISTAYLLDDGYDPDVVRPPNSKWLYENDRLSYDLCVELLGADKAAFKSKKREMVAKPNPAPVKKPVINNPKILIQDFGFLKMHYDFTTKANEASLEEYMYRNNFGGSLDKAASLYSEAYNIGLYISENYPNKTTEGIKRIIKISSEKMNLSP